MDVNRKSTRRLRLQRYLATLLFLGAIGLLGWLSTQYVYQADWTAGSRNSLGDSSRRLLQELDAPVIITAFARNNETLRKQIRDLIGRYQRVKSDIRLNFVNPDAEPERVRELGVTLDGELRIAYQGRSERVQELTEQAITNALLRVARQGERWVAFLAGHGERDPHGQANHDLGQFGAELERRGLKLQQLNLARDRDIPDNVGVLVVASPQVALLPGEVKRIRNFLDRGGNLLWLTDPGEDAGLEPLAEYFGLEFLPGVIVDANTQLFGIQNPEFVLIPDYPPHPITRDLPSITLFPGVQAMLWEASNAWQGEPLLSTLDRAWTETGPLQGEIRFDADSDERRGPLDIGYALQRTLEEADDTDGEAAGREQRVVVIGDGDFLSNSYLGNGGNLDLGLNIVHWLGHDDDFIAVRPRPAPDLVLTLSPTAQAVIGFGFLFAIPGLLLGAGLFIWLRRRKR
ncbi:Gldg family protein [Thiohalobacter sp. IOR34]|uniref:GldG family protein n=1 Tax=Thiohalobacter sp. IOR34 TaxID=3057176 RepID=UPI0025B1E1DA|nr:DUF4350 domain-containing protein [Thiohalobacter sp. IOR34]WJW75756.1 Gldg family protein [Thiohalobacter sp. IOR34]